MSKIAFVVLAAGAASAFVVPTSRTPARTAPVMAAKPGGLAEFQQKAIATAVSLMLVAALVYAHHRVAMKAGDFAAIRFSKALANISLNFLDFENIC